MKLYLFIYTTYLLNLPKKGLFTLFCLHPYQTSYQLLTFSRSSISPNRVYRQPSLTYTSLVARPGPKTQDYV